MKELTAYWHLHFSGEQCCEQVHSVDAIDGDGLGLQESAANWFIPGPDENP